MPTVTVTITGETPTSVVLRDPSNVYGVRRTDDQSVTVAAGTAMIDSGSGVYSHEFTGTEGVEYEYAYRVTFSDGETVDGHNVLARTGYAGRYTTALEVVHYVDRENSDVLTDADRDGIGDDDGVMAQAIRTAESEIDAYLGGPVESFTEGDDGERDTAGESAADLLNGVAYKLAAYNLAAKRGFSEDRQNEFERVREEALGVLERFAGNLFGVTVDDDEDTPTAGTFQSVTMVFEPTETRDEFSS